MFNFLKKTKKNKPLAVILINDASIGKDFLLPRVDVLTAQAAELGLEVVCAPLGSGDISACARSDRQATTLYGLKAYAQSRDTVFLLENHYHVSSWWISDLLEKTAQTGKSHCPNGLNTSYLVSHLYLFPQFYSISAPHVGNFIDHLASGGYYYWHPPHALFEKLNIPVEVVEITAQNVKSFYGQAVMLDLPLTFVVETNSSCNYHCLMCPYHGGRQRDLPAFVKPGTYVDMPFDIFKRVIDEIAGLKRSYQENPPVTINPYRRGELLMYPHWRDALKHIKSKKLRAYFSTNGSLWTDDDIEFVLDEGLDQIQISIDGHDKESHRLIRLNDEFDTVANTLRRLVRRREERNLKTPYVQLAHTINERNVGAVNEYVETWLDKSDSLFLGPENYADIADHNKKYKTEFAPVQPKPDSYRPPCNMVKDVVWVNSDGECILCIGSKLTVIGNVNTMSMQEILESPVRMKVIQDHINGNFNNPVCKGCQNWYSAYMENIEEEEYSLRISPDTQYYMRKRPINIDW